MRLREKKRRSMRGRMMKANIGIILAALVLCGGIFAASVFSIVGDYIHADINYFLTTTTESLESRLKYCEEVVRSLRDSRSVMAYLEKPEEAARDEAGAAFEEAVDISAAANLGNGSVPLVEEIYLFDGAGQSLSTSYYAMISEEKEESRAVFSRIYQRFMDGEGARGENYAYYPLEDSIYLVFSLFDDRMDVKGRIVYKISAEALSQTMGESDKYQGSFWAVYDSRGAYVAGERVKSEDIQWREDFKGRRYAPYIRKIGGVKYRLCHKDIGMDLQALMGIPENQAMYLMYDSAKIYVMLIAVITALGCAVSLVVIYRLTRPIEEITDKLKEVRDGDFESKLPEYDSTEFNEISETFNGMTAYINHLVNQVYEKQISIKDMELKFLQSQMNPHFMFNVLNTMALQAKMDQNEELYRMISSFSRLVQAKIYRSGREKVKIGQELEYVEYYLYLQNYRFGEHLKYEITVEDGSLKEWYIPKLCIQLIVENAVVHGIEPKVEGGTVTVRVYEREGTIRIDTEDDGVGFEREGIIKLPLEQRGDDPKHNHVGLNNANHIIGMMYGEEYGITIYSKKNRGTAVSIRIPFDDNSKWEDSDEQSHVGRR